MAESIPVLEARSVVKTYGHVRALRGASLSVHAGEIVGLVGNNGASESTLLKTIAGSVRADEGEILIDDEPVEQTAELVLRDIASPMSVDQLAKAITQRLLRTHLVGQERAMPGAARLLEALAPTHKLAVASNAPEDIVRVAQRIARLPDVFEAIVAREPPHRPKPAPDVYLEACRRIGVAPGDAIAVEDSTRGARAALSAGTRVIVVGRAERLEIERVVRVSALTDHETLDLLGVPRRAA